MKTNNITPELIRAALLHISANLSRDEWARIGMAINSEFPDETGRTLFLDWSATADSFDSKAAQATWKSIKASGGVSIATLLHQAQGSGFTLPKDNQARSELDPETAARLARERAASQKVEQAQQHAAHEDAARDAQRQWDEASETGESPYLARKGVKPYGVRFSTHAALLVPLRDASGKLWNRQRIAPEKPPNGGPDKLFVKGGRKSGLWHLIGIVGTVSSPIPGDKAGPAVLLIAEGYATAASPHQATGYPVAVAFDAGNLAHVAKALRSVYPATLLVLCGDDDMQTLVQSGHNPGRDKATAAARAARGLAVFPDGLPVGGSDFNDSRQAAGLDAVRTIVLAAIDAHQASRFNAQAAQNETASKCGQSPRSERIEAQNAGGFDRFFVADGDGVYYLPPGDDGGSPRKVCGVLRVVGLARDAHDN